MSFLLDGGYDDILAKFHEIRENLLDVIVILLSYILLSTFLVFTGR